MPKQGYLICRIQKHQSIGSVRRALDHAYRKNMLPEENQNINFEISKNNNHNYKYEETETFLTNDINRLERENLIRKTTNLRQKSALVVEHLITYSPEVFEGKSPAQQTALLEAGYEALILFYRSKGEVGNLFFYTIHVDEKTPHMSVFVVPKYRATDKKGKEKTKLGAKHFFGGRDLMRRFQTFMHEKTVEQLKTNFWFEDTILRGLEHDKPRKNVSIKDFYANIKRLQEYFEYYLKLSPENRLKEQEQITNNLKAIDKIKKQEIPDPNIQKIIEKYEKLAKDEGLSIDLE